MILNLDKPTVLSRCCSHASFPASLGHGPRVPLFSVHWSTHSSLHLPPHSNADLFIYHINRHSATSTAIMPHFVFLSHLPITTFQQFSQSGHFPLCKSFCKPKYRGGEHHITAETLLNVRIPSLTSSSFPFSWLAIFHSLGTISNLHTCPQGTTTPPAPSSLPADESASDFTVYGWLMNPTSLPVSAHLSSFTPPPLMTGNSFLLVPSAVTWTHSCTNLSSETGLIKVTSDSLIMKANRCIHLTLKVTPIVLESPILDSHDLPLSGWVPTSLTSAALPKSKPLFLSTHFTLPAPPSCPQTSCSGISYSLFRYHLYVDLSQTWLSFISSSSQPPGELRLY